MNYFKVHSMLPKKEKWERIEVESSLSRRLPYVQIIGIPPKVANFQRERVVSALDQIGIAVPRRKLTINFPHSEDFLDWTHADLAIAACILGLMGRISPDLSHFLFVGTLNLDGRVGGEEQNGVIVLKKQDGVLVAPPIFQKNDRHLVDQWVGISHLESLLQLADLPIRTISSEMRRDRVLKSAHEDWNRAMLGPILEKLVQIIFLGGFSCLIMENSRLGGLGERIFAGLRALEKAISGRESPAEGDHSWRFQCFDFIPGKKEFIPPKPKGSGGNPHSAHGLILSLPECACMLAPCGCNRGEKKVWDRSLDRMERYFPLKISLNPGLESLVSEIGSRSFEEIWKETKEYLDRQSLQFGSKEQEFTPSAKKLSLKGERWQKRQINSTQSILVLKIATILSELEKDDTIKEKHILEANFYASELCCGNNFEEKGYSRAVPNSLSVFPVSDSSVRTTLPSI